MKSAGVHPSRARAAPALAAEPVRVPVDALPGTSDGPGQVPTSPSRRPKTPPKRLVKAPIIPITRATKGKKVLAAAAAGIPRYKGSAKDLDGVPVYSAEGEGQKSQGTPRVARVIKAHVPGRKSPVRRLSPVRRRSREGGIAGEAEGGSAQVKGPGTTEVTNSKEDQSKGSVGHTRPGNAEQTQTKQPPRSEDTATNATEKLQISQSAIKGIDPQNLPHNAKGGPLENALVGIGTEAAPGVDATPGIASKVSSNGPVAPEIGSKDSVASEMPSKAHSTSEIGTSVSVVSEQAPATSEQARATSEKSSRTPATASIPLHAPPSDMEALPNVTQASKAALNPPQLSPTDPPDALSSVPQLNSTTHIPLHPPPDLYPPGLGPKATAVASSSMGLLANAAPFVPSKGDVNHGTIGPIEGDSTVQGGVRNRPRSPPGLSKRLKHNAPPFPLNEMMERQKLIDGGRSKEETRDQLLKILEANKEKRATPPRPNLSVFPPNSIWAPQQTPHASQTPPAPRSAPQDSQPTHSPHLQQSLYYPPSAFAISSGVSFAFPTQGYGPQGTLRAYGAQYTGGYGLPFPGQEIHYSTPPELQTRHQSNQKFTAPRFEYENSGGTQGQNWGSRIEIKAPWVSEEPRNEVKVEIKAPPGLSTKPEESSKDEKLDQGELEGDVLSHRQGQGQVAEEKIQTLELVGEKGTAQTLDEALNPRQFEEKKEANDKGRAAELPREGTREASDETLSGRLESKDEEVKGEKSTEIPTPKDPEKLREGTSDSDDVFVYKPSEELSEFSGSEEGWSLESGGEDRGEQNYSKEERLQQKSKGESSLSPSPKHSCDLNEASPLAQTDSPQVKAHSALSNLDSDSESEVFVYKPSVSSEAHSPRPDTPFSVPGVLEAPSDHPGMPPLEAISPSAPPVDAVVPSGTTLPLETPSSEPSIPKDAPLDATNLPPHISSRIPLPTPSISPEAAPSVTQVSLNVPSGDSVDLPSGPAIQTGGNSNRPEKVLDIPGVPRRVLGLPSQSPEASPCSPHSPDVSPSVPAHALQETPSSSRAGTMSPGSIVETSKDPLSDGRGMRVPSGEIVTPKAPLDSSEGASVALKVSLSVPGAPEKPLDGPFAPDVTSVETLAPSVASDTPKTSHVPSDKAGSPKQFEGPITPEIALTTTPKTHKDNSEGLTSTSISPGQSPHAPLAFPGLQDDLTGPGMLSGDTTRPGKPPGNMSSPGKPSGNTPTSGKHSSDPENPIVPPGALPCPGVRPSAPSIADMPSHGESKALQTHHDAFVHFQSLTKQPEVTTPWPRHDSTRPNAPSSVPSIPESILARMPQATLPSPLSRPGVFPIEASQGPDISSRSPGPIPGSLCRETSDPLSIDDLSSQLADITLTSGSGSSGEGWREGWREGRAEGKQRQGEKEEAVSTEESSSPSPPFILLAEERMSLLHQQLVAANEQRRSASVRFSGDPEGEISAARGGSHGQKRSSSGGQEAIQERETSMVEEHTGNTDTRLQGVFLVPEATSGGRVWGPEEDPTGIIFSAPRSPEMSVPGVERRVKALPRRLEALMREGEERGGWEGESNKRDTSDAYVVISGAEGVTSVPEREVQGTRDSTDLGNKAPTLPARIQQRVQEEMGRTASPRESEREGTVWGGKGNIEETLPVPPSEGAALPPDDPSRRPAIVPTLPTLRSDASTPPALSPRLASPPSPGNGAKVEPNAIVEAILSTLATPGKNIPWSLYQGPEVRVRTVTESQGGDLSSSELFEAFRRRNERGGKGHREEESQGPGEKPYGGIETGEGMRDADSGGAAGANSPPMTPQPPPVSSDVPGHIPAGSSPSPSSTGTVTRQSSLVVHALEGESDDQGTSGPLSSSESSGIDSSHEDSASENASTSEGSSSAGDSSSEESSSDEVTERGSGGHRQGHDRDPTRKLRELRSIQRLFENKAREIEKFIHDRTKELQGERGGAHEGKSRDMDTVPGVLSESLENNSPPTEALPKKQGTSGAAQGDNLGQAKKGQETPSPSPPPSVSDQLYQLLEVQKTLAKRIELLELRSHNREREDFIVLRIPSYIMSQIVILFLFTCAMVSYFYINNAA